MGCFNVTCNLSGLPIYREDEVLAVVCLPNQRPRSDVSICYSTDLKVPAFLPLYGKYDSYGCVEKVQKDLPATLFGQLLNNRLKQGQLQYADTDYSGTECDAEQWLGLISNASFVVSHSGVVWKGEKFSGKRLSVAFVLREAYEKYAKIAYPDNKFKEIADNWLSWYLKVHQIVSKWEKENNHRKFLSRSLLQEWGTQATRPNQDLYPGLDLPDMEGEEYENVSSFQQFLKYDRCCDKSLFNETYFNFIKHNIEHGDLKDTQDERWISIRDGIINFMILSYMMDVLHRVWLPTVTASQDRNFRLESSIQSVNASIARSRLKNWINEGGE